MSRSYLLRWAEEAMVSPAPGTPDTAWCQPEADSNKVQREAALAFVNRAAARLVCPDCRPDLPPGNQYAIAVPAANDDARFRNALNVLRMDHLPVVYRHVPLGFRPEVEHRNRSVDAR